MSDDGWRIASFGKPYVYSLFAAPFARSEAPTASCCSTCC
jgi:hypothetical protein